MADDISCSRRAGGDSDADMLILLATYYLYYPSYQPALLPGGPGDPFIQVGPPLLPQNTEWFCDLLRQRVSRSSYHTWWDEHPNCSLYQADVGCILLQPIVIPLWNGGVAYSDMFTFILDYGGDAKVNLLQPNEQRQNLYTLINEGMGGPTGIVCFLLCPCVLSMRV